MPHPRSWYKPADEGLHVFHSRPGLFSAIFLLVLPGKPRCYGTLLIAQHPCPVRAASLVLEDALDGCCCSSCRPITEDAGPGLRLVRATA